MRYLLALLVLVCGAAQAVETNVYWQTDLHQGTSIIAYGRGSTEDAAKQDCYRLQATTRAMTATETRRSAVAAVTAATVRWCNNPRRYSTVSPDLPPAPVNCVVSAWSEWAAGPWSTCAAGQQSRTETRTRTITTQPANGGTACPVLIETRTVSQACGVTAPGTAVLNWTPPTHNDDGSSLTNLAGYRIHYGTIGGTPYTVQVANAGASTYTLTGLRADDWHFCVRAYNTAGAESACSNVVWRTIR